MKHKPTKMKCWSSFGVTTPWSDSVYFHSKEHTSTEVVVTWGDELVDKRSCSKLSDLVSFCFSLFAYLDKPLLCGRSANQFMAAGFHLLDLWSDYQYLITVPIYSPALFWLMITSIILPLIPALIVLVIGICSGEPVKGLISFSMYFGLFDLIEHNLNESGKETAKMTEEERKE